MINEPVAPHKSHCCSHSHKRISWSAILVGALVALGLSFLLNLFGLAIGLSAFTLNETGASVVAIGGILGIVIGIIASMLAAGYAAGYLGRTYSPKRNLGIVYGFTTWALALILGAIMVGPIGHYAATSYASASELQSVSIESKDSANSSNTISLKTKPNATTQNANHKTTNIRAPANTLVWSVFVIFILFFIGALSSCFGACWGMHCCRED